MQHNRHLLIGTFQLINFVAHLRQNGTLIPKTQPCEIPESAFLQAFKEMPGAYADCFVATVDGPVDLPKFVTAFYTSRIFKLERVILKYTARVPSTDEAAEHIALGTITKFAAWSQEKRAEDQLLMCDLMGNTRSWFMAMPQLKGGKAWSNLYFGSAIMPASTYNGSKPALPLIFRALLGFHKVYSRMLLRSALVRLGR